MHSLDATLCGWIVWGPPCSIENDNNATTTEMQINSGVTKHDPADYLGIVCIPYTCPFSCRHVYKII